jgi:iron complex outermembrane receptor protein
MRMKKFGLFFLFSFFSLSYFAQSAGEIKGTVKDQTTGETVVGASVVVAEGKVAITDINGNYSIKVDSGQYTVSISYVGFETKKQKVKVGSKSVTLNFSLETKTLTEVEVVADVAKIRETPVAFSTISTKQIKEELGTRDLPMILNSTPGVYATEQGGGSGDARVSIRGFDQRNVAVMVDGVPVNDMENGQVYWSNWDGLGDITQSMQVQRGLGASKLAIASVGGTINIITKGIDGKFSAGVKQEVNNYGLYKTSFGYNSGLLKGGWGITLAGSRKWGNGFADGTFTDSWSYFFKIQKRFKKHLLSLSANGAPQSHGQRSDKLPLAYYSEKLARDLTINVDSVYQYSGTHPFQYQTTATQGERGITYNPNWGILNNEVFNDKVNFFHKPQFNLSHFWTPNEKLSVSTVAYVSIGKGGGTGIKGTVDRDSTTGQLNFQQAYNFNTTSAINSSYSSTEHPSNVYLRASNNDHIWYGLISTWNYKINDHVSALIGIDGRYYKGTHYQSVYDLIGGGYAIDNSDKNVPGGAPYGTKHIGDKVSYYNDAIVMWGGAFAQLEYKKNKWSTFLTATVSETGYQRIDYYKKKDLVLPDTTIAQVLGYGNTYTYNGVTYTQDSPEAKTSTTLRKWFLGYTVKGGANYNINDHQNVFVNLGYLNMAPRMNVVFDNNNKAFLDPKNQKVYAIEGGYGFHNQKFATNINLYYTLWKNKPPSYTPTVPDLVNGGVLSYNINGLNALHKGIEIDFIYKLLKNLDIEGIASFGDWKTISGEKVYVTNEDGIVQDSVDFSAKNVHVGDAAQIQIGGSIRYEIIKNFYIKPRFTYFGKNYANFDPILLTDKNKDRESWKMPNYGLLDLNAGYGFTLWKLKFDINAGIMNILNATYITDAQNGAKFDPTTATVFVGMGRRFNAGLKITF